MVSTKYGRQIIIISAVEEVMLNGLVDVDTKRCDRVSKGIYTQAAGRPCVDLQLLRRRTKGVGHTGCKSRLPVIEPNLKPTGTI